MESNITLSVQLENLKSFLLDCGFTSGSIKFYSPCWNKMVTYAKEGGILSYNEDIGLSFLKEMYHVHDPYKPLGHEHKYVRAVRLFNDYALYGRIAKNINRDPYVPEQFGKSFDAYLEFMHDENQRPKSIKSKRSRVKKFLEYLDRAGFSSLQDVTREEMLDFMIFLKSNYSSAARGNILYTVKNFLLFCEPRNYISCSLAGIIKSIYTNPNETLPSTYTQKEVGAMLETVDKTTGRGKKDYAMLLLASIMGMRAYDIVKLKSNSIRWEDHCIEFFQSKTGIYTKLPMPAVVETALAEYLSCRPDSGLAYVFVRERAPFGPYYDTSILSARVSEYMHKAGIDTSGRNHGPHALRHSMASWMLADEQPLPVIASALGHDSTKNTSHYIRINIECLRSVGLEVPDYEG